MKEVQLKQINKAEENNLKSIQTIQVKQINKQKLEKQQIINSLPTWSIEPPLEIKRGN